VFSTILWYEKVKAAASGGGAISDEDKDDIAARVRAALASQTITILSPLFTRGALEIVAGDDYTGARVIPITILNYSGPSLNGMAVELRMANLHTWATADQRPHAAAVGTATIAQTGTTLSMPLSITGTATDQLDRADAQGGIVEHQGLLCIPTIKQTLKAITVRVMRAIDPPT
jgi:hypothetical protein